MPRSPNRLAAHPRRSASCAIALAIALPLSAFAQDAAYVDSPAGRLVADPARADGGSVEPGTVVMRPGTVGPGAMDPMMQMQMQMLGISVANEQRQAAAGGSTGEAGGMEGVGMQMGGMPMGGMSAGGMPSAMGAGMPGGMGMGSGMGMPGGMGTGSGMQPAPPTGYAQPQASPMQQIGAGMMQDAANVMDAGIRRSVYGDDAAIMVPAPGTATVDGGGW